MGGGPATSDDIKKMQEAEAASAAAQAMLNQNAQVGPGAAGRARPSDGVGLDPEEKLTYAELKKKYGIEDEANLNGYLGGGQNAGPSGGYGGYGGYGGPGGGSYIA